MSKKNIQLNIKADDLKKKLNIKDGYTPIKGKDYFDGKTPIIDTQDIVTRASKLAQVELEKKIVPPAPFKITDQDIEDISLDVQSQIEPKFEELKKEIEETKIKAGQRINTGFKAFKNLTDAPHSYNGQASKIVSVKSDETGLEFIDPNTIDNQTLQEVTDNGSTTTNSIEANSFVTTGGTSADFVKGDGSLDSTTYLDTTTAGTTYVPYTGANADIDLGTHDLTTTGDIDVGGINATSLAVTSIPASSFDTPPTDGARNNYTGVVGFRFTVDSSTAVSRLGRLYVAGNTQNHVIKLWISTNTTTPIASGTILAASTSDANNFKWVDITPVVLTAGNTYHIAIDETAGGDTWKDLWAAQTAVDPNFNIVSSVYQASSGAFPSVIGGMGSYDTPAMWFSIQGTVSGTNTGDQDLSGLVPYTGATGAVNLGTNLIMAGGFIFEKGTYDLSLATLPITGVSKTITLPNATGYVPLGTGANTQIAYWNATNTLTSNAGLTTNGTGLTATGTVQAEQLTSTDQAQVANELAVGTTSGKVIVGDITGNARGTGAVDIQLRSSATQVASGANSVAFGQYNTVSADSGIGIGILNTVSGYQGNQAFGADNTVSASSSRGFAFGGGNTVSGTGKASAFGLANTVSGYKGTASGYYNTVSGDKSTASGYYNTVAGNYATAVGAKNSASGNYSTASGYYNNASGIQTTAIGYYSQANGITGNTAIGYTATASGDYVAMAIGYNVTASASYATAIGVGITNSTANSIEIGVSDANKIRVSSAGLDTLALPLLAGDATNNFYVDSHGHVTLNGTATVWDDMRIAIGGISPITGAGYKAYTPSGSGITTQLLEFAKNDNASFTVQLPHNWKEGTDLKVHVHWTAGAYGSTESGKTVGWKVDYSWANIDGTFGAMATADLSDATSGTNHTHQMTPVVSISGTGKTSSSMIICNVKRTDTGADDTWAGTATGQLPLLLEVDFHYEIDKLGEDTLP